MAGLYHKPDSITTLRPGLHQGLFLKMIKKASKYLTYVGIKLKTDSSAQILYHALNAIGIRIQPFYIVQETLYGDGNPFLKSLLRQYTVSYLGTDDIRDIAGLPDRNTPLNQMLRRFADGNLCIGVKDKNRIAAFTWCDLTWCNFPGYRFRLENDEAYLFDAHTAVAYRGIGLAPYVRYRLYEELALIGRTRLYSFTERFNNAAMRFKQKLHGRIVDRGVYVELFGKWSLSKNRYHFKKVHRN